MRKFLKITGVIFGLCLLVMFSMPFLFKERINEQIRREMSSSINGSFDFKELNLSLFRDFPNFSIGLIDPVCNSFVSADTSELFRAKELYVSLGLWDVLFNRESLTISKVRLESGHINLIQYDSLLANYLIVKEDSVPENKKQTIQFKIDVYEISNSSLNYMDHFTGQELSMQGINHQGTFSQSSDVQYSRSTSDIESLSLIENNIPLLKEIRIHAENDLEISDEGKSYKMGKSILQLNEFAIHFQGLIKNKSEGIAFDNVEISSPSTAFKDIFSLLPNAYTKDFKEVASSGNVSLKGNINGTYSDRSQVFPSWNMLLEIQNGVIKYPGKDLSLNDFHMKVQTENSSQDMTQSYLNVENFGFSFNNESVMGHLRIDDLKNNLNTKGSIKGALTLDKINAFYPLEKGSQLGGKLRIASDFEFNKTAIMSQNYNSVKFAGECNISEFLYKANGLLDTRIPSAHVAFSPDKWDISGLKLFYGKSDFSIDGAILHPLALLTSGGKVQMNLKHRSESIDLDELKASVADNGKEAPKTVPKTPASKAFGNVNVVFTSQMSNLKYDVYSIRSATAEGILNGNYLEIPRLALVINENDIKGKASFVNILDYALNARVLKGQLFLNSANIDLDKLMVTPAQGSGAKSTSDVYFSLPEDMDLDIQFAADKMKYAPLLMNQLKGKVHLINQTMEIQEATAEAAGGKMQLSGIVEAKTNMQPVFDLKYDLKRLEFKNAFKSFHTIAKLAPLFNFIDGFFNSTFIFQGALKKDNFPDLMSLNVNGIIETLDGAIKGFKPLQEMASRINLKELSTLNIKNSKNWINVEKGVVKLSEFTQNIGDVKLTVDGMHPLEGDMAYNFLFDIPSNKTNAILKTIKLDEGIKYYNELMSKIGLSQKLSTDMLVQVKMGGTFLHPNFKVGLKPKSGSQSDGSVLEQGAQNLKDTLASAGGKILDDLKAKGQDEFDKISDSLKKSGVEELDKLRESAEKELRKKLDTSITKGAEDILKGPMDSLGKKLLPGSGKNVDSIKNKIKEWNPFKKEKK